MTDTLKARDDNDVVDAVQWAVANGKGLEIVGHGSKRGIGRPAQTDLTLDLTGLTGITLYEPEELVLSAKAGTPLAEIEALVAASHQMLAFEPMDYGPVLGGAPGRGTLGGTLAANVSGPRRIKAGAARDHVLGFSAVSGRGESFKSGGRVVKNVTGYDLSKLMAGSWGTLGAMTVATVKVLPRPESEETLLIVGLSDADAVAAMTAALGAAGEVSAAAHLPAAAAERAGDASGRSVTALRLEGIPASIAQRRQVLEAMLKQHGACDALVAEPSRAFWQRVRDVIPLTPAGDARPLWRISTAPSAGARMTELIGRETEAEFLYDWAGGLVWAALAPAEDAGAGPVRRAVTAYGGHATLIRASASQRAAADVFQPQDGAVAGLSRRVKESFDPKGVLNPGRMWAGV